MHEAGLASALAATIRERGLEHRALRLVVRGGQTAPADFDASLLAHLAAELGAAEVPLRIEHLPATRQCAACATTFVARALDGAPCPACGGPALPAAAEEQIELEYDETGVNA